MSNSETLKDRNLVKTVSNHDKTIPAEVAQTPNKAYINHEGAEQKAAEIERTDLKYSEVLQMPKQ